VFDLGVNRVREALRNRTGREPGETLRENASGKHGREWGKATWSNVSSHERTSERITAKSTPKIPLQRIETRMRPAAFPP